MGIVEQEARRARRIGHVQKALLTAAVVGGLMLIGAAPAPNLLGIIGGKNKYRAKHQAKAAIFQLARRGYLVFERKGDMRVARLTPQGKEALALEEQKAKLQLQSKKRWDKRWRVIIFDIPERRRSTRNLLRNTMQGCGFLRLQDSVWLYPYDCENFLVLLKAELKLGSSVLYLIVEKIENDSRIKDHFNLK